MTVKAGSSGMRYEIKARCIGCYIVKLCRRVVTPAQRVLDVHICRECATQEA